MHVLNATYTRRLAILLLSLCIAYLPFAFTTSALPDWTYNITVGIYPTGELTTKRTYRWDWNVTRNGTAVTGHVQLFDNGTLWRTAYVDALGHSATTYNFTVSGIHNVTYVFTDSENGNLYILEHTINVSQWEPAEVSEVIDWLPFTAFLSFTTFVLLNVFLILRPTHALLNLIVGSVSLLYAGTTFYIATYQQPVHPWSNILLAVLASVAIVQGALAIKVWGEE